MLGLPMVQITINNSYSKVIGLNLEQERLLKAELSYMTGNYQSKFGFRRQTLMGKKGDFPTGLLGRLIWFLEVESIRYVVKDLRKQPMPQPPVATTLDPYAWQKEAVLKAQESQRGIISASTGAGKSLVIALIASRLNVKTLVIVPSLEIKKQLSESLLGALNGKCDITVENIDSTVLKTMTGFDCLIIDEAHHVAAKTYRRLNKTAWAGIYYRFFLTATPFRSNSEENLLFESIAGQVIYQLDYKEAVSQGYIVPVEGFYFDIPKQLTDAYAWAEVYSQLVVNNQPRNIIIANLLNTLKENSVYTLCLVKEVAHGKKLAAMTGLPFVCGEDEESRQLIRQFNDGGIKVLIATEGIMGEGIDTKPCEYVIIAGLGKAKSAFMQKVGRAVRKYSRKESAKVVLFRDLSHKFLLRHYRMQVKILKEEYGTVPMKVAIE